MISKMLKASEFLFVCLVITQHAIPTDVQGLTNEVDGTNCHNKGNVFCPEYGLCCERTEFCHERTCESCFPGNITMESRLEFCRQLIRKQTKTSLRSSSCDFETVCRDLLISAFENDLQLLSQRLNAAEKETKETKIEQESELKLLNQSLNKAENERKQAKTNLKRVENETKQVKTDLKTVENEAKQGQVALGLGIFAILAFIGAGLTAFVLFVKKRKTEKPQTHVETGNKGNQNTGQPTFDFNNLSEGANDESHVNKFEELKQHFNIVYLGLNQEIVNTPENQDMFKSLKSSADAILDIIEFNINSQQAVEKEFSSSLPEPLSQLFPKKDDREEKVDEEDTSKSEGKPLLRHDAVPEKIHT